MFIWLMALVATLSSVESAVNRTPRDFGSDPRPSVIHKGQAVIGNGVFAGSVIPITWEDTVVAYVVRLWFQPPPSDWAKFQTFIETKAWTEKGDYCANPKTCRDPLKYWPYLFDLAWNFNSAENLEVVIKKFGLKETSGENANPRTFDIQLNGYGKIFFRDIKDEDWLPLFSVLNMRAPTDAGDLVAELRRKVIDRYNLKQNQDVDPAHAEADGFNFKSMLYQPQGSQKPIYVTAMHNAYMKDLKLVQEMRFELVAYKESLGSIKLAELSAFINKMTGTSLCTEAHVKEMKKDIRKRNAIRSTGFAIAPISTSQPRRLSPISSSPETRIVL